MNRPILSFACGLVQVFGLFLMILFLENKDSSWYLLIIFVFGLAPVIKLFDQDARKHVMGIPAAVCGVGLIALSSSTFLMS